MSDDLDWVAVLRAECAETSQGKVASAIGYSGSVVNQVLKGVYKGDIARVELVVRGRFMGGEVMCPALGAIRADTCVDHQKRAKKFNPTNRMRTQMYRACQACPRFKSKGELA